VRCFGEPVDEDFGTGFVVLVASTMRDLDGRHFSPIARVTRDPV
jgi:hypothetical protein